MDKFEMKEGTGSLWHETNCTVVRKGKIKIDGQERYASILKYTHQGVDKYELSISIGLLHINEPENKQSEKSPDIGGKVTFNNVPYRFGGWRNIQDNGEERTGVKLSPIQDNEDNYQNNQQQTQKAPF